MLIHSSEVSPAARNPCSKSHCLLASLIWTEVNWKSDAFRRARFCEAGTNGFEPATTIAAKKVSKRGVNYWAIESRNQSSAVYDLGPVGWRVIEVRETRVVDWSLLASRHGHRDLALTITVELFTVESFSPLNVARWQGRVLMPDDLNLCFCVLLKPISASASSRRTSAPRTNIPPWPSPQSIARSVDFPSPSVRLFCRFWKFSTRTVVSPRVSGFSRVGNCNKFVPYGGMAGVVCIITSN